VRALTFRYAGIAAGELAAARAVAGSARVKEHRIASLPDVREVGDMGDGRGFPGLPRTYIPMRNAIFYSHAAAMAEETGAGLIIGGHNRDDRMVFDDVSAPFFADLQGAFRWGSRALRRRKISILRPLRLKSKSQVVRYAASLGVPLGLTWSCHLEGTRHCGRCQGCLARKAAFRGAGVADPLRVGLAATND
jgi:7-cyano-7-deazaguanine synthase